MNFATYARKSVYSDKSDSVKNQARMCREYCECRYEIGTWTEYSDEDYTGANTDRPGLQQLMRDVRAGRIDVLVVYQLDRLSRSVRDFSQIYDELDRHGVQFLSLKENIDVSTPIGRAMMNITASFAQMEREQTAIRVTDNMIGLADKGLWVGGRPPIGYRETDIVVEGRRHHSIEPVPEESDYVNWLFDEYIASGQSVCQLEKSFRQRGIRTRAGGYFSSVQIRQILKSPYYAPDTPEIYDYYARMGCQMVTPRSQWDGAHGVAVYGRTSERTGRHEKTQPEKWRVCTGIHEPIMSADKWLAAQVRIREGQMYHATKYPPPLLKGVLRCTCGRRMIVHTKVCQSGIHQWYACPRREREGVEACPRGSIRCDLLDRRVLDQLREISVDRSQIQKYVADTQEGPSRDFKSEIARQETQISRLTASLALAADSPAAKYIITQIENADAELTALRREASRQDEQRQKTEAEKKTLDEKADEIGRLIAGLDGFTAAEKNRIIRSVVRDCTWDGRTLFLRL